MKILWITNILMPDIAEAIGKSRPSAGGWMYSLASSLTLHDNNLQLVIATVSKIDKLTHQLVNGIDYYVLPLRGKMTVYQKHLEGIWKSIYDEQKPDVVHIHGTEYPHGLAFLNACPYAKSVISIQGMVGPYSRYYTGGLSKLDIYKNLTIIDFLTQMNILKEKKDFEKRGVYEKEAIKRVNHIIGRTSWDKAHTWAINSNAEYHFCNETLRSIFYEKAWCYENCEHHSIFISQASYPIKGFHQVLKAMPFILSKYPDTKIRVAGADIVKGKLYFGKTYISTNYGSYIKSLLRNLGLVDKVIFLGPLQEEEMCNQYLKSNVFICPSSIENSPNSLGEAQLLGMPCVASYSGGIPDMMRGREEWLYRFEEIEMLAELVCKAFELRHPFNRQDALDRHNLKRNTKQVIEIYKHIIYENY